MDEQEIRNSIVDFFESYVRAFEQYDAFSLADHIAFPCHVSGDTLIVFPSRESYIQGIEPLLALYRKLDVVTAQVTVRSFTIISGRLVQAVIHWQVMDGAGRTLYTHEAGYTLARRQERWAIAAIAFNEMAKIRALGAL